MSRPSVNALTPDVWLCWWRPIATKIWLARRPSVQWAAVTTHSLFIRVPPQKAWPFSEYALRLTVQGNSSSLASVPPTILLLASLGTVDIPHPQAVIGYFSKLYLATRRKCAAGMISRQYTVHQLRLSTWMNAWITYSTQQQPHGTVAFSQKRLD